METIQIVQVLGGLGIFIFGMRLMSESLQNAAGDRLRNLLSLMTRNRALAVFSGLAITSTIQSSSATTVLVVGFVNAGLLKLTEAIGVIMGANIGTTITAWIVSFFGFKVSISAFALPSIVIGVILHFVGKERTRYYADFLVGFGFLFLGLQYLKDSVPDTAKNPETFQFLSQYTNMGFESVLLFVLIGTLLTIAIQSSSASTAITITLAYKGFIPLEAAYGMVLGENIGTTITANLAAIPGNLNSKKAALAHTFFNLFGVIWALLLFIPFTNLIDFLIPGDPLADKVNMSYHISAFHTLFNLTNTFILVWFVDSLSRTVSSVGAWIYGSTSGKESDRIQLLSAGSVNISELSALEVSVYTKNILKQNRQLFFDVTKLIQENYDAKIVNAIFQREEQLDAQRTQILMYLNQLQTRGISGPNARSILETMDLIKNLEEIGDNFAAIGRKMKKGNRTNVTYDRSLKQYLSSQLAIIINQYDLLISRNNKMDSLDESENANFRSKSYELRAQAIRINKKMNAKIKKKKYMRKNNYQGYLYSRDIARNIDNISRLINSSLYAET
jgi:phosphate:Na+ symporter